MLTDNTTPSPSPTQIPDLGGLTEGLPGWARVVVILAVCLAVVVVALPKVLGYFGSPKHDSEGSKPAAATAPPPVAAAVQASAAAATSATEIAVVTEAMSAIVGRIEDRLDRAIAEHDRLRQEWDAEMEALRGQLSQQREVNYELNARLIATSRELEEARQSVQRLHWELDVARRRLG